MKRACEPGRGPSLLTGPLAPPEKCRCHVRAAEGRGRDTLFVAQAPAPARCIADGSDQQVVLTNAAAVE